MTTGQAAERIFVIRRKRHLFRPAQFGLRKAGSNILRQPFAEARVFVQPLDKFA
jgi:hypothetical protein